MRFSKSEECLRLCIRPKMKKKESESGGLSDGEQEPPDSQQPLATARLR